MNILITGSSGLIGTALKDSLSSNGHEVFRMLRSLPNNEPFYWQPSENKINFDNSIYIDAVIHLAGASIADGRWNDKRKKNILESREIGTSLLSSALAKLENKPKVLISGSAIGFYGNTGDQTVDESSNPGSDFLSDVCQRWEKATQPALEAGIRTVHIRIGVVLSSVGGALQKMIFPFKMGLGGIIGNGQQYVSWVSINDITGMIQYIIEGWSLLYSIYYVFHMRYRSSVHKIEKEQKLVGEHRKQKKGLDVSFPLHPDRFQREQAFENIKHWLHCDLS